MLKYSGKTSSYHHKRNNTPNPADVKKGLRKVWFLDAQWSDCPVEVENEVKQLWQIYELGNVRYMLKLSVNDLSEHEEHEVEQWNGKEYESATFKGEYLIQYIREHGIPDNEKVVIHWWW